MAPRPTTANRTFGVLLMLMLFSSCADCGALQLCSVCGAPNSRDLRGRAVDCGSPCDPSRAILRFHRVPCGLRRRLRRRLRSSPGKADEEAILLLGMRRGLLRGTNTCFSDRAPLRPPSAVPQNDLESKGTASYCTQIHRKHRRMEFHPVATR